jgi:branched-chain amino acid transport system substrate-binding protein
MAGRTWRRRGTAVIVAALGALLAVSFVLAGCGSSGTSSGGNSSAAASEIVIGTDASMSGILAGFGGYQKWALEAAVADQNAKGGVTVDGVKHKIKLVLLDDKSDGNVAANNVDTLITKYNAVAIIGPVTPSVGSPAALAAERNQIPYLMTGNPLEPFLAVKKQWTWAYDFFISAAQLGNDLFTWPSDLGVKQKTNGKIAICVDNSPDGPVFSGLWKAFAPKLGYTFVEMPTFPSNATTFGSLIGKLKTAKADWVIALGDTPTLIALRKQMDAEGYTPKMMEMERGAQLQQFGDALGKLADGVTVNSYWLPDLPYPGAAELGQRFLTETKLTMGQILGPEYAAGQIMMDAITKANSTDPGKLNSALAQTDGTYVAGPVKFAADHTSVIPSFWTQWQNNKTVIIWPKKWANATMVFPLP